MAEQINPYQLEVAGPFVGQNKSEWYELRKMDGHSIGKFSSDRDARAELNRLQMRNRTKTQPRRAPMKNDDLLGSEGANGFLREHRSGRM